MITLSVADQSVKYQSAKKAAFNATFARLINDAVDNDSAVLNQLFLHPVRLVTPH